jgi:hypothetical protein
VVLRSLGGSYTEGCLDIRWTSRYHLGAWAAVEAGVVRRPLEAPLAGPEA